MTSKSRQIGYARKLIKGWLARGQNKNYKDIQEIDLEAFIDGNLRWGENQRVLEKQYHQIQKSNGELKEEKRSFEKAQIEEQTEHTKKEFNRNIETAIKNDQSKTEDYFKELKHLIRLVGRGYSTSLIIEGKGGLGKTYEVIKTLTEIKADFVVYRSHSTPLKFYEFLFYNNGKTIVLDDLEGILENASGISILKGALWPLFDKLIVSYSTTSEKLEVPPEFEFTGQIIFCVNSLRKNPELEALRTRGLYYYLDFPYIEIITVMFEIAKNPYKTLSLDERLKITRFILENTSEATRELNFRTLFKALDIFLYCKETGEDWKSLVLGLLGECDIKLLVKELSESGLEVREQARGFIENTGKSRATFFRIRRDMGVKRQ